MMDYPLLVHQFLERANTFTPSKEIVTREGEGTHRYTYADLMLRTSRLSNALSGLGVGVGDRVGTFAWNTYIFQQRLTAFGLEPWQLLHERQRL